MVGVRGFEPPAPAFRRQLLSKISLVESTKLHLVPTQTRLKWTTDDTRGQRNRPLYRPPITKFHGDFRDQKGTPNP